MQAKTLADLLRTNYLPEVYIPDDDILQLRDLARHKEALARRDINMEVHKSVVKGRRKRVLRNVRRRGF